MGLQHRTPPKLGCVDSVPSAPQAHRRLCVLGSSSLALCSPLLGKRFLLPQGPSERRAAWWLGGPRTWVGSTWPSMDPGVGTEVKTLLVGASDPH